MRSKEDAQDYRYFPDPDLIPIAISDEWLEEIRAKQPEFRPEKMARYKEEFQIPDYDIQIITETKHMADIFEGTVALGAQPKKVSNWLMGESMRLLKEKNQDGTDLTISPKNLAALIKLIDDKVINQTTAKEIFAIMFEKDIDPVKYVEENGLKQESDEGAIKAILEEVIAANPQAVADYHAGKEKALGALVGQTMKRTQGKADPGTINKLLREML